MSVATWQDPASSAREIGNRRSRDRQPNTLENWRNIHSASTSERWNLTLTESISILNYLPFNQNELKGVHHGFKWYVGKNIFERT